MLLILGLVLFVALVVVHEFGHFIAARRNGVEVEEFGIGFPPRAKTLTKKNDTIYSLNWLPLGGFVRLKGENDAATAKGSFGAASFSAKVKIMLAGVAMNLAAAYVLLTLVALIGMPKLLPHQFTIAKDTKITRQDVYVGYVEPDSPADKAGLKVEDKLISVTHHGSLEPLETADELPEITKGHAGETIQIAFEHDGEPKQVAIKLRTDAEVEASKQTDQPQGYLGVSPAEFSLQRSTWSAPIVAAGLIKQFTVESLKGLGSALFGLASGDTARATENVAGPVGVFVVLKDGSILGAEFILFVIAVISLTLAIMNVLPIPALDGGRLFVMLLFRLFHKPLTKETEDKIHGIGFVALMMLFVLITIVDVRRFF